MPYKLVHIGFGNMVVAERVVSIISPDSAPIRRLKDEAREAGLLVDVTQGRKTRDTDNGQQACDPLRDTAGDDYGAL